MTPTVQIVCGDALAELRKLDAESVQCAVTSPPYFGLRSYMKGEDREIGKEKTPAEYVSHLLAVFQEVHRVLKQDGTLWLVIGDSYASSAAKYGGSQGNIPCKQNTNRGSRRSEKLDLPDSIKCKDLIGIPWLVAFALRDAGWYLRSEITWCKKAPMPESVTDRPTSATEKIFLFSKSERYFYNAEAVRNTPSDSWANDPRWQKGSTDKNEKNGYEAAGAQNPKALHRMFNKRPRHDQLVGSNMRNYWLLGPEPFGGEHFATFPSEIPRKCILAGSKPGDTILDPFFGSGTTGMVAIGLGRSCIGIDLNPEYCQIAEQRCRVTPGLAL